MATTAMKLIAALMLSGGIVALSATAASADGGGGWVTPQQPQVRQQPPQVQPTIPFNLKCGWNKTAGEEGKPSGFYDPDGHWIPRGCDW